LVQQGADAGFTAFAGGRRRLIRGVQHSCRLAVGAQGPGGFRTTPAV
jgi:hypothetical protein